MLTGPFLKPVSGKAKQLVMLLHGYNTNGEDLISLGEEWRSYLPDAEFLSPHAPFLCEGSPFFGRQWFGIENWTPESVLTGAQEAYPLLDEFITNSLKERDLQDKDLAIMGFSQGCIMALYTALKRPNPCAAVLGYSGAFVYDIGAKPNAFPEILLIHGQEDEVLSYDGMLMAQKHLKALGVPVETLGIPRLGHGIDGSGLHRGGAFMKEQFDKQTTSQQGEKHAT